MRLSDIAQWTQGNLFGDDTIVHLVATDSRVRMPGALFVALSGDNFDGHDFVAAAKAEGAAAALVSYVVAVDLPQVVVDDTQIALGDIARAVRAQRHVRVIGITGSNGKTTVKTLVAAILALHGKTHVNVGNLNNEIGLPLSLLALPKDAQYAVLEMGAGKPGDIAYLAAIARPEIGLVNNIAPAHLERMGTLSGIAETKGALYAALPPDGVAIINADDAFAPTFATMNHAQRTIRFGLHHAAEVRADIRNLTGNAQFVLRVGAERIDIALPLAGKHNVMNALAAAAVAHALEVPLATIKQGLESASAVQGRLVRHAVPGGWILIDDSYNANPGSMRAAIDTLSAEGHETWLVLGDMRELGPTARQLHAQIGEYARDLGIARLFAVGELSRASVDAFGPGAKHYETQEELIAVLTAQVRAGVTMLVKGSRGSAMDLVVKALLRGAGAGEGTGLNAGGAHAA
ncbi:MAG: UDP-N-acetylmuramoyl-tripeptide--D-alanyl-D-alanine ligase [Gammaproteobacteria bacterium]|nr:MAG: UDP-N-acetylmuramoyl-tripeptide--D-alanyl-D-alanine ligase [Gammaproteobacteria bacterium]